MSKHALPVRDVGAEPPPPPSKTPKSREGKIGLTVYLSPEARSDLRDLADRYTVKQRKRVTQTDVLHKALDDMFQAHDYPRHFGTKGDDE